MSYGFIYFAINSSMPGIVKIGTTTKHPEIRLAELSGATACPQPFTLIAFFDDENALDTERTIHSALEYCRVSNRREFFQASYSMIRHQVAYNFDKNRPMGVCATSELDFLLEQEDARHTTPLELDEIRAWMEVH